MAFQSQSKISSRFSDGNDRCFDNQLCGIMKCLPHIESRKIIAVSSLSELLIFNTETRKSYSLNKPAAIIFRHCDGVTLFDDLARRYQFTEDLIYFALDRFQEEKLLMDADYISPFAGMSRSEVLKRINKHARIIIPKMSPL